MKDWTKFDALVRSVMICHKFGHKEPHYSCLILRRAWDIHKDFVRWLDSIPPKFPNSFGKHLCLATKEYHWNQISTTRFLDMSWCSIFTQLHSIHNSDLYLRICSSGRLSLVSNNLRGHEQVN